MKQEFNIFGKVITVQGRTKQPIKTFEEVIHRLTRLGHYTVEVRTRRDFRTQKIENVETVLMTLFNGGGPTAAQLEVIKRDWLDSAPTYINESTLDEQVAAINKVFYSVVRRDDQSMSVQAFIAAETKRSDEEQQRRQAEEAEERLFRAQSVEVPEGQKAVLLRITRDDSNGMSDYYAPHVKVKEWLIGRVESKHREDELTAKAFLALLPAEIQNLTWTWHTEKYANGHGNYLMSSPVEGLATSPSHKLDEEGDVPCIGSYEIVFGWSGHYIPFPNLSEKPSRAPQAASTGQDRYVRRNEEQGGIEVKFAEKPAREIIDALKSRGFRWSGNKGHWWTSFSESKWQAAQEIASRVS